MKLKKWVENINNCNIFIMLYCSFMALSAYKTSALTGMLLMVIVSVSFLYFLYVIIRYRQPMLLKWLSCIFVFFAIYGLIYIFFDEPKFNYLGDIVNKTEYLKKIAVSLLPVYPFFHFTKKGLLTRNVIMFWIPIFLLISVYAYYQHYSYMMKIAMDNGSRVIGLTNNYSYIFVSMIPLLFIKQRKTLLQYACIFVCVAFIVLSVKRGAIIIGGISIIFFIYSNIKNSKGQAKQKLLVITIFAVVIGIYYCMQYIENSKYFVYRLDNTMEGNMSGRDVIYSSIWKAYLHQDTIGKIIGSGPDSSIHYTGMLAHNDWLEILINQGVLGVILYLIYFFKMYKTWWRNRYDSTVGLALGGLFIVLFLRTLFSMGYTEYSLFTCMAYGYCVAKIPCKITSRWQSV